MWQLHFIKLWIFERDADFSISGYFWVKKQRRAENFQLLPPLMKFEISFLLSGRSHLFPADETDFKSQWVQDFMETFHCVKLFRG